MEALEDVTTDLPQTAMVFQCRRCLQILGDTSLFVCAVKSQQYVVLQAGPYNETSWRPLCSFERQS